MRVGKPGECVIRASVRILLVIFAFSGSASVAPMDAGVRLPAVTSSIELGVDTCAFASESRTATHGGMSYFFCATACRERFLRDPKRYVEVREDREESHSWRGESGTARARHAR